MNKLILSMVGMFMLFTVPALAGTNAADSTCVALGVGGGASFKYVTFLKARVNVVIAREPKRPQQSRWYRW